MNNLVAHYITDLENPKFDVRQQAIDSLVNLGSAAVLDLICVMQTQSGRKAWEAACILAQIDDPRWIPPMRALVKSRNITLASVAAAALEQFGVQEADTLMEALPTAPTLVQMQIVSILERFGDARAVVPLMRVLRTTDCADLRYLTIQALMTLGDARALSLVKAYLDSDNHQVRERARAAVERLQEARR